MSKSAESDMSDSELQRQSQRSSCGQATPTLTPKKARSRPSAPSLLPLQSAPAVQSPASSQMLEPKPSATRQLPLQLPLWKDKIDELPQAGSQHSRSAASSGSEVNTRDSHEYDHFQCFGDSSGKPVAAGAREEEDWETVLDELPAPRKTISPTVGKEVHSNGKSAVKQRGRGSFTFGGMGLYSDNLELNEDKNGPGSSCSHSDHSVDGDGSNVLVLDCSSKITTKDVEDVVEPFSREGSCTVRWVDNTRALASFSSPTVAREALVGINDGRFKVSMLSETDVIAGSQPSMNDKVQPVPRPASSAKVAQRMIASALSRQGISKQLRAKNQGSLQEIQEQERQRKLRLQLRAQLRDEAWGSDDD